MFAETLCAMAVSKVSQEFVTRIVMNKYFLGFLILLMISSCSGLWNISTFDCDFIGSWKSTTGHGFSNVIPATQPQFEFQSAELKLTVNPDPMKQLDILWGPAYLPIIPNPFLILLPFVSNHDKFSVVVLLQNISDSLDTISPSKWTMKPSEARFSFVHNIATEAHTFVIGKEESSSHSYNLWYSQYVLRRDTVSEPFVINRKVRGVRFSFTTETKDVNEFFIEDLGLYKDGIKQVLPPLRLYCKSGLRYYPLSGPG